MKNALAGLMLTALLTTNLAAQSIYGTLTGVVSDPSKAVVAGATLTLVDQASGSQRDTVANNDGYYTFVSVPPGAYRLTVSAKGFEGFRETGISILGGDKVNVNVALKLGSTANVVEVTGDIDLVEPGQNGPTTLPVIYGPAYFNADLGLFRNVPIGERMKLQFRFNAYNFLNHPLWSFNGNSNLTAGFSGTTGVLNTPNFGFVTIKQGHRIVQLAANFNF